MRRYTWQERGMRMAVFTTEKQQQQQQKAKQTQ